MAHTIPEIPSSPVRDPSVHGSVAVVAQRNVTFLRAGEPAVASVAAPDDQRGLAGLRAHAGIRPLHLPRGEPLLRTKKPR